MTVSNISTLAAPATAASQSTLNPAAKKSGQDFNALLQALSSSDNSGTQNALAGLLQELLSQSGATQVHHHRHHHHHHHADAAQPAAGAAVAGATAAGTASAGHRLHITA
jgi:hypothetical protein